MKSRSNRLILLVGVVIAAVAFVAIVFLVGNPSKPADTVKTTAPTVVASVDIPLGTQVRSDMLTTKEVDLANRAADAIGDPSQVVGQIARLLKRDGRRVVVADADWRRMMAFEAFRRQQATR